MSHGYFSTGWRAALIPVILLFFTPVAFATGLHIADRPLELSVSDSSSFDAVGLAKDERSEVEPQYFVQTSKLPLPIKPPFPDGKSRPALVLHGGSHVDIEGMDDYFKSNAAFSIEFWVRPIFSDVATGCTLLSVMDESGYNISFPVKFTLLKKPTQS